MLTPVIFLLSPDELRHVLADSEARAVITTPDLADAVRAAREGVDTLRWVVIAGDARDDEIALHELEQSEPGEIIPRADGDLAALMYTGGTTGRAKGVMLSHEMLWRAGEAGYEASYLPGVNRSLVTLPLSYHWAAIALLVTAWACTDRGRTGAAAMVRADDVPRARPGHGVQISAVILDDQALLPFRWTTATSSLRYLVWRGARSRRTRPQPGGAPPSRSSCRRATA